jgi:hypothetical protein
MNYSTAIAPDIEAETESGPLLISNLALHTSYELNSVIAVRVTTPQRSASRLATFSNRITVGEAADQMAKEFGLFMLSPTLMDSSGHVHRRTTSMMCMINGELLELVNLD